MKLLFQQFLGQQHISLQQYGLKVKFVDIDLQTLNFNLSALEKRLRENKSNLRSKPFGNSNDFTKTKLIIGSKI